MYLLVVSVILAVLFLVATAFLIAYFIIYNKEKKENPKKVLDLTTPLEYILLFFVPLLLVQGSSYVLFNISFITNDFLIEKIALIFGSVYNTLIIGVAAFIIFYKLIFRKNERHTLIASICIAVSALLVIFGFTIASIS